MRNRYQHRGFSLTEVLLAVGALAVGMVFISGTFLTGIHFSTIATERSYAAVVADEAFAKVRIYGSTYPDKWLSGKSTFACVDVHEIWIDFNDNGIRDDNEMPLIPDPNEFAYPSINTLNTLVEKQYFWSALCRPVYFSPGNRFVQVTVFVCRKLGNTTTYTGGAAWPIPIQVGVSGAVGDRVITVTGDITFINDGYTIVENGTGNIYRVVERGADPAFPEQITLAQDKMWQGGDSVWVIPPPVGGGKNPCIAVYQKIIRF